ncbi:MAG: quinoprotein dehydrogenase-associated putative ABC transporter substrate-binding protein [Rhodospirillales bacterium]
MRRSGEPALFQPGAAGFENRIASLLASDLHAELRYTWNQQRRSFFRRTLLAGACDAVISVPAALPIVSATAPYFTSAYVFVTRRRDGHPIASFDDPFLRTARIGLQLVGADGANTPPAMALARRGITQRITGFPMWADAGVANPQGRIIDAVASGQIDVAIVWGPFGGYFAKPYADALRLDPIVSDPALPALAFTYAMAIGVRKTDPEMRDRLQGALNRHRGEIDAILRLYGIPLVPTAPAAIEAAATGVSSPTH